MRRYLACLVFVCLFVATPTHATIVLSSLQPLQWVIATPTTVQAHNVCSFFSINEEQGYWLGALHCHPLMADPDRPLDFPMLIAGETAEVYLVNEEWDAMVLVSPAKAKAFKLAPRAPKKGEGIVIVGFPAGILTATHGVVLDRCKVEKENWGHYTAPIYPGHSGSPVMSGFGIVGLANFVWNPTPNVKKAKCENNSGGTPWHVLKALVDAGVWQA